MKEARLEQRPETAVASQTKPNADITCGHTGISVNKNKWVTLPVKHEPVHQK